VEAGLDLACKGKRDISRNSNWDGWKKYRIELLAEDKMFNSGPSKLKKEGTWESFKFHRQWQAVTQVGPSSWKPCIGRHTGQAYLAEGEEGLQQGKTE